MLTLICLTLCTTLLAFSSSRAQSSHALNGTVCDPVGAVIAETAITLYSPARILRTTTDSQGRFVFQNVPPGTYQLEASRAGFKTITIEFSNIGNREANPLSITLNAASGGDCGTMESISYDSRSGAAGGELTVKVLNSNRPLANAAVSLKETLAPREHSAQTNGAGEFRFTNLRPGQYVLKVFHHGYQDAQTGHFWITRENQTTVAVQMVKQGLMVVCQ